LLTANGSVKRLNQIVALGVFLNISLNLILIPYYKAMGAAMATLCTQLIVFFLQFLTSNKILKVKVPILFWGRIILFAALTVAVNFSLTNIFKSTWFTIFVISIIINSIIAFPLKLIRIQDLRQLWLRD